MGVATPPGLSDEKAARMMVGLREGRTLDSFHVSTARFAAYCSVHLDYGREASALLAENIKASNQRKGTRKGVRFLTITHCRKGHPFDEENTAFQLGKKTISRLCRICSRAREKRRDKFGCLTEQTVRKVFSALDDGRTINTITNTAAAKRAGYKKITSRDRLRTFQLLHPKLGNLIWKRGVENAKKERQGRYALIHVATPKIVKTSNDIMDVITAVLPRNLPNDLRDDAIQNICMAVLEGRLERSEIAARAHEFIRAEYKNNHNAWGPRSLDLPIYRDSRATLLDTLSAESGSGYWDVNLMASTGRRK